LLPWKESLSETGKDADLTARSVGRVIYTFGGRTFCQLAPQKDDYQRAILIINFFGPA